MNRTFRIAFSLKNTYRVNTILYSLKQIPLIRRILPQKLYCDPDLKIFANIVSGIWEFVKAFLGKFLYFLLMITVEVLFFSSLDRAGLTGEYASREIFLHIFVLLTLVGAWLNTYLFNPTKDKYYALILLRMDAREYALVTYGYEMLKILAGYLIFGLIFGHICGLFPWQCILLPFSAAGIKLTVVAWSLRDYERTGIAVSENQVDVKGWVLIALALAAAYGLPFLGWILPEMVSVCLLVCGIVCGGLSLCKVLVFREYREVYQQILTQYLSQVEEVKGTAKRQSEKMIQIDGTGSSNRTGFEYLNEIFIRRHQKILWKSSKRIALISLGIVCVVILGIHFMPEYKPVVNHVVLTNLPYFAFIMYFVNRGAGFTNVLFMNCDHSLLTYSFYKQPESILRLFQIRLREIMKVNLLPAAVIGGGLALLLYQSGGTEEPLNYVMLMVSILCISMFFSVHYLTIYYLLQPYNAGTEIRCGTYRVVVTGTYFVCYGLMRLKMPAIAFGLGTVVFCAAYCVTACVLVYRLAPKTFRLRA